MGEALFWVEGRILLLNWALTWCKLVLDCCCCCFPVVLLLSWRQRWSPELELAALNSLQEAALL